MTEHAPLILDIAGTALAPVDRARLAHPMTGGIILFQRNWQDRAQLSALCAEVKSIRADLLITVDHEGGPVQRFRTDGFTHLPPDARLRRVVDERPCRAGQRRDGCDQRRQRARVTCWARSCAPAAWT